MASNAHRGLQAALDLSETGLLMREARYRREHPDASDSAVDAFMEAWLLLRPGAPEGDAVGRPVTLPRRS